jgi:hypothetical protein
MAENRGKRLPVMLSADELIAKGPGLVILDRKSVEERGLLVGGRPRARVVW